jgi:hypothetical protein
MNEITSHLRPYQQEIWLPVMRSITEKKGLTFTVEIARQGGKNELSAYIEAFLLLKFAHESKNVIKCSPTFKPQTVVSMLRLKETLSNTGINGWVPEMGYIIRLAKCRVIFLSAEETSNVVGNTAHLLLEVDEAQDVNEEKYTKEFKPMGSTTNVTNILYGTTWDENTLLERMKQTNMEMERKDGVRRHFRYDWQEIAKHNPDYRKYVEAERERLGENHPLFMTQYRLLPIRGGGGFLNPAQRAQLQGNHWRRQMPEEGKVYAAGIDLAGEAENEEEDFLKILRPKQDSTVLTIGEIEMDTRIPPDLTRQKEGRPKIKIVEQYEWTGIPHTDLYIRLLDLLKNVWQCRRIAVDATGAGEPVAAFLKKALGSRVKPFKFTARSKTELGFNLLAAINAGGLKIYAGDGSKEYKEFWHQMERARSFFRPSQTMNFFVEPSEGHDDYLMSTALLVEAAGQEGPREARGR